MSSTEKLVVFCWGVREEEFPTSSQKKKLDSARSSIASCFSTHSVNTKEIHSCTHNGKNGGERGRMKAMLTSQYTAVRACRAALFQSSATTLSFFFFVLPLLLFFSFFSEMPQPTRTNPTRILTEEKEKKKKQHIAAGTCRERS